MAFRGFRSVFLYSGLCRAMYCLIDAVSRRTVVLPRSGNISNNLLSTLQNEQQLDRSTVLRCASRITLISTPGFCMESTLSLQFNPHSYVRSDILPWAWSCATEDFNPRSYMRSDSVFQPKKGITPFFHINKTLNS